MRLNHTTHFFRWDIEEFKQIASRYQNYQDISVLSIPCSTGQEVYSYSAILQNLWIPYTFDGIDISPKCIEIAKKWSYAVESILDDIPLHSPYKNYFPIREDHIEVSKQIREKTNFFTADIMNINDFNDEKKYDIIICQNLLIHFQDSDTQLERIIHNISKLLTDTGTIFTDTVETRTFARYSKGTLKIIWDCSLQKNI